MKNVVFTIAFALMLLFALLIFFNPSSGPVHTEGGGAASLGNVTKFAGESSEKECPPAAGNEQSAPQQQQQQQHVGEEAPFGHGLDNLQTPREFATMQKACATPGRRLKLKFNETFDSFVQRTFDALNNALVGRRPIYHLLDNFAAVWEQHGGLKSGFWAEFGVFRGFSLNMTSDRLLNANKDKRVFKGVVAGFDSFAGLPVDWRNQFGAGKFGDDEVDLYSRVKAMVSPDVELYKGWFQNTLPSFMSKHPNMPATFIHHDGDLFVSTAITFQLLAPRIVPGTIMCFDELQGYHGFEQHEILALFLWMFEYDAELCALATHSEIKGELRIPRAPVKHGKRMNKEKYFDSHADLQSSCFQVLSLKSGRHHRK